jgi:hypothetical protein
VTAYKWLLLVFLCAMPHMANAHSFSVLYALPIPFWAYVYSCTATLVVTFGAAGYFFGSPTTAAVRPPTYIHHTSFLGAAGSFATLILRIGALFLLALSMTSGFIGTYSPVANINMTLFWIVFLLGFTYLTAFAGDIFELVSPWKTIIDICEWSGLDFTTARIGYPKSLGYLPALSWYMVLVWIELFALPQPKLLSIVLLCYTTIVLIGAWLFGRNTWFRYGDTFSVLFRLVGLLAPVAYVPVSGGRSWRVRLRAPFVGVLEERPDHLSLLVFVLFMLSSTTFDALHETQFWHGIYWRGLLPFFANFSGFDAANDQTAVIQWYLAFQQIGLVALLLLYYALYIGVVAITRVVTSRTTDLRTMALMFVYTLVPIALVYNVTHYFTLLVTQGQALPWLITDPFGFGWNLLRIPPPPPEWPPLNMGFIWHTEMVLIVVGHLISVCLAHLISLQIFSSRRDVVIGQLPMLILMLFYTGIGLWVLALPITVGG